MTVAAHRYTKKDFKDTLERRRRNAPRQPSDDVSNLSLTKLKILEFTHLYGGFTTIELVHKYLLGEGVFRLKDSRYTSKLLLEMFHDHGVIEKPEEQFSVKNPYGTMKMNHVAPIVYKVSERGEEVLKSIGLWNEHAPRAHGWYKHQMMTACIYQMFHIGARDSGIQFISQHELMAKEKFIQVGEVKVYPDAVFVLHLHKPFLFFFEMDRGTEKGSKKASRKTWGKSIEFYKSIFDKKLYRGNYELPDDLLPFLATVTVDANMERRILENIEAEYPEGFARMLVHTTRAFGPLPTDFYPPKYFNVLDVNWNRYGSGYPPVQFSK